MDLEETIAKLEQSLEEDYGDYSRTNYVIEKLQINKILPKSDYAYIDRMIKLCEPVIIESKPEEIAYDVLSEDLIKCHHCNIKINLNEKSVRKNDFWFHDKCFEKIPTIKTETSEKIQSILKERKISKKIIQVRRSYPQMIFSGGLLTSLVGSTYLLSGEIIASVVGICGSALYFTTFKNQIIQSKKKKSNLIKTGIPGFDSTLSEGIKKNSSVLISGPPGSEKTIFGL